MSMSAVASSTDAVERSILIQAPRSRVWRALSNAEEFGRWFGADLKGQRFVPGERTRGPNIACGHENVMFDVQVEAVEPEHRLAFRWHPYALDPLKDYSGEEPTLVEFELTDAPGGTTRVTVVESGFDKVPAARRAEAFRMHGGGWEAQMRNLDRHAIATA